MQRFYCFMILSFSLLLGQALATTIIEGTVTAQDGKIPAMVYVELLPLGQTSAKPIQSLQANASGHFKLEIKDGAFYTLHIAAVNHYDFSIPILPAKPEETILLQITPKGYDYKSDFKGVKIIGDWNGFSMSKGEDMTLQADGSYSYQRPADTNQIAYQLLNVENGGHSINGTQADSYKYDGGGDFQSVVKTENGVFKLTFNPTLLAKYPHDNKLEISASGDPAFKAIIELSTAVTTELQNIRTARRLYTQTHGGKAVGFEYDMSNFNKKIDTALTSGTPLLQRFAAISRSRFLNYQKLNKNKLDQLIQIAPPQDALWGLAPTSLIELYSQSFGDEKGIELLAGNLEKIKTYNVRGYILSYNGLYAKQRGDLDLQREMYKKLSGEYKADRHFRYYIQNIDPEQRIASGKTVPNFKVTLLHSDRTVSNKSLAGSYYMIDFWAVWCGPCRGEMHNLDKAYKDFKDKNFKVLSLSFDAKESDIDKYRKETWPMPWMHGFLKGGFRNPISKRFEVSGIPKPVLVDPNGKILATGSQLRGENLEKTLAKYLK